MSVTSVSLKGIEEPSAFFAEAQNCNLGDEAVKQEYLKKLSKMMRGLYKEYRRSSKIDNQELLRDLANRIVKVARRQTKLFLKEEHDFSPLKFKRWAWISLILNLQSFITIIISGSQDFFHHPRTEKGETQISPLTLFGVLSMIGTYLALGFNLIKSQDHSSNHQLQNKLYSVLSTSLLPNRKIDVKKDQKLYTFLSVNLKENYERRSD